MTTVWIKVSADKYELPEVIVDTAQELAEICGTTTNNISSWNSKHKAGKLRAKYLKVEIEEGEDNESY